MKVMLYGAYEDLKDGSCSVTVFGSRQDALDHLGRTEEELENGCVYDDGTIIEEEAEFEIVNGVLKLTKSFSFYTDM